MSTVSLQSKEHSLELVTLISKPDLKAWIACVDFKAPQGNLSNQVVKFTVMMNWQDWTSNSTETSQRKKDPPARLT